MGLRWYCKGCGAEVAPGVTHCEECMPAWEEPGATPVLEHDSAFDVDEDDEDDEESEWDLWAND